MDSVDGSARTDSSLRSGGRRPFRRAPLGWLVLGTLLAAFPSGAGSAEQVETKLLAADGAAGDVFGYAVSISGTTALVGAHQDDGSAGDRGSAYVFIRSGGGWQQQAKLTPPVGTSHKNFGYAVALSGDTALVGVELDTGDGTTTTGAYVFVRQNAAWTQQALLVADVPKKTNWFHVSLALSGDTALVGAWRDETNGYLSGAAVAFVRDGTSWSEQARLLPADGEAFDAFGFEVALSGDTALVGALGDDDMGDFAGAAYVFERSGSTWSQQAKLLAGDAEPFDNFGDDVAISGSTALVGASREDTHGEKAGAAYVFVRNGSSWLQEAKLMASDGEPQALFGVVAVSGDTALVGAQHHDSVGATDAGAVYVFTRSEGVWTEVEQLVPSDIEPFDAFGRAVSVADGYYLAGAADDEYGTDSGAAYVFGPQGLRLAVGAGSCPGTADLSITGAPPSSELGVVRAGSDKGFVKGGKLCGGMVMEIGEPFVLPPVWMTTDAAGNASASITLPADRCWLEAVALTTCETSGAIEVD